MPALSQKNLLSGHSTDEEIAMAQDVMPVGRAV